jgi:hypothetical protein
MKILQKVCGSVHRARESFHGNRVRAKIIFVADFVAVLDGDTAEERRRICGVFEAAGAQFRGAIAGVIPQRLKPPSFAGFIAKAKALAYLEAKANAVVWRGFPQRVWRRCQASISAASSTSVS